jgi:predicted Holliday junction resolvase-like endonuclease
MATVEVSGTISSLLSFYKHERNIFGRCPHCQEPFRLSEVKLTYGKEPPRDLLSRMKKDRDKLETQLAKLDAEIADLEDSHQHALQALEQTWRSRVELEVEKQLQKSKKEIGQKAIDGSWRTQLGKTLEKVVPVFPGFGHHSYDVRPIFDPIDFVVFEGYYQGNVTDIFFVEFKTNEARMSPIQKSVRSAIDGKRVHFEEKRLGSKAIEFLTNGKVPGVTAPTTNRRK